MEREGMDSTTYIDPLDYSRVYDARTTVVIGFAKPEVRRDNLVSITGMGLDALDVYRDPAVLVPKLLGFPCFIRLMDYATYLLIEDAFRAYVKTAEPCDLTPTIVYPGYEEATLIDNPAVIDAGRLHPTLLAGLMCFMRHRGGAKW